MCASVFTGADISENDLAAPTIPPHLLGKSNCQEGTPSIHLRSYPLISIFFSLAPNSSGTVLSNVWLCVITSSDHLWPYLNMQIPGPHLQAIGEDCWGACMSQVTLMYSKL